MTPLEMLRYHVTGAIARGEKQAIVEVKLKGDEMLDVHIEKVTTNLGVAKSYSPLPTTPHSGKVEPF